MEEKQLSMEIEGVPVDLILRRANIGDDMRRGLLAAKAMKAQRADSAEQTVAVVIYPRCMACAVSGNVNGKPVAELSVNEFIALPYEIGEAWLGAALALNPGWRLAAPSAEEEEDTKKIINVIARLDAFYCPPKDDNGDFADVDFGLSNIPAALLEQATDILFMLETIEWKWDVNTLLEQPSELFNAILKVMIAGNKLKKQNEKKKSPTVEED